VIVLFIFSVPVYFLLLLIILFFISRLLELQELLQIIIFYSVVKCLKVLHGAKQQE